MRVLPFGAYGFAISIYVISIMIAISGISLGIGYAINEKKFKEFGKNELYQSVINGVIIGGMLALFSGGGILGTVINSITLTNGTALSCTSYMQGNPAICLSYDYLVGPNGYTFMGIQHSSILTTSTTMLTSLLGLDTILGIVGAFKINFLFVTLSFSYVVVPIINEIQYIIKILTTVTLSAVVQASVLSFIAIGTLTLILPTGLILRAFYPTRKLGGFLIALSLGLYVILPLSYVFNIMLVNLYSSSIGSAGIGQVSLDASGIENMLLSMNIGSNSTVQSGIVGTLSGLVSSAASSISDMINELVSEIAYFIVYIFILPAFSLIVTGISVREFAHILGSEVSFGRLGMLI